MPYLTDLNWLQHSGEFTPEQEKILLGLSDKQYQWRTKERLQAVTGLTRAELENALKQLIAKDLIRPSFSKNRNIIYGLRERVD